MTARFVRLLLYGAAMFPVLYRDGKRVKKEVPRLPEADGMSGSIENGDSTMRVLAIGESTIAGVGVNHNSEGFVGGLAQSLAENSSATIEWKVEAKSGYNVRRVIEEILPNTKGAAPDVIVVGVGGNDAFEFRPPWKFREDVKKLIEDLRLNFPEPPIFFVNMPPVRDFVAFTKPMQHFLGEWIDLLGSTLEEDVQEYPNVNFNSETIRLEDWISYLPQGESPEYFFSDGVHPSAFTYQLLGKKMGEFIIADARHT